MMVKSNHDRNGVKYTFSLPMTISQKPKESEGNHLIRKNMRIFRLICRCSGYDGTDLDKWNYIPDIM